MNVTATLIGQVIVFAMLIWFVKGVLWEPIITVLEDRKKRIADGLGAAEEGQRKLEEAEQATADAASDAKAEAAEIIAHAQARSKQIIEEAKGKAMDEAERVKAGAEAEIEAEVSRAKDALREQVSGLAVDGASKILGKEIDAGAHKAAIDELVSQI